MSEWQELLVRDLINTGIIEKPLDGNHGETHPKGEDFIESGIPFVMASDINGGKVDLIHCKFISETQASKLRKGFAKSGDVLLTHKASLGRTAIVPELETEYIMLTPQVTYYRIKDSTRLFNKYLKYYFDSPFFQDTLINHGDAGSTRAYIGITAQHELPIVLPPLPEQKAIASVLSSLDDKIDLLHRQNKTLEAMAETLFRQWFIEEAKEDWFTVQVKDIVKQIKPGTNYQPKRLESGIPFLNVRNLKNGQIDLQGISFISQEEYERVHKAWKPEVGDVLISRIGTLGIVAVLGKRDMPMAVHYNMLVLKPNLTNTAFLYFLLRSQYFQDLYSSKARQSVQEYVAVEDAEAIELKLPLNDADFVKKQEQFSDLFNKIRANLAQIQTLEKLRDTLLPKLMSGEVRVQYQTEEVA
ncbi:restriction endonuclease subunit S [Acinetobacter baumannii]|uniref:restriction endonuclease subunit S n=1 Tax=Acinetobacter baumannii TaxID=470 RepID=UPI00111DAD64|nr:restriction endonuclease subunit S [Acinetobacter baumannii]TPT13017.1 restriction endonuclease subunit S [Acinetobacter baumannii]